MEKVKIELDPHTALTLYTCSNSFIELMEKTEVNMSSFKEIVEGYKKELLKKMSMDQIDEALAIEEVNGLIGKYKK
jgi:hypothetical protein